ncbi:contact-dependent growth inhibition system immunity protein [Photobacterium sp. CCB-ST2H9]|uniref:contact-dependent growth inhibition system immunity protein n=1 Tax=unclassified Photobacterium TaxID=2628852 RepID=UPI002004BAE0|nr:contact-dependent growth inhibition system immunity protein [Photobacterium sp. CCB-ST2H9]UTM56102.1 contact-dependent growth inhibition system immunity protein [Photobacterium sp. CCB-ST2H9]
MSGLKHLTSLGYFLEAYLYQHALDGASLEEVVCDFVSSETKELTTNLYMELETAALSKPGIKDLIEMGSYYGPGPEQDVCRWLEYIRGLIATQLQ